MHLLFSIFNTATLVKPLSSLISTMAVTSVWVYVLCSSIPKGPRSIVVKKEALELACLPWLCHLPTVTSVDG